MIQGLARFDIKQSEDTMTRLCGTYSYLAPEIFFGQRYTDKADVFSMGIILWEIAYRVIHGMSFKYITLIYPLYSSSLNYSLFFLLSFIIRPISTSLSRVSQHEDRFPNSYQSSRKPPSPYYPRSMSPSLGISYSTMRCCWSQTTAHNYSNIRRTDEDGRRLSGKSQWWGQQ